MRTNIVIDDQLLADAQRITGLKTKKAVVEEALKLMVRMRETGRDKGLAGQTSVDGRSRCYAEG